MYRRQPLLPINVTLVLTPKLVTTPTSIQYVQKLRECIRWAHRKADQFQQKEAWHHKQNYDRHSRAVPLREGDTVLVCVTTLKSRHKIQNQWENREYVVEWWPYPNLQVYMVCPRDGEGCSWTLHRNCLLLMSNKLEQAGLTLVPPSDSGLPADGPTKSQLDSQQGLPMKQSNPVDLKLTGLTTSDMMSDHSQAGQDQPAPLQQSACTMRNQLPWRYCNFALQWNTTTPGAVDVWDGLHTCLHLMVGLCNGLGKKYSVKALYLKSVRHEQFLA